MYYLLPNKDELVPIINDWETFYDSSFNENFSTLGFKNQLQIIVDIVRQTILYEEFPNPKEEEDKMIGDSYTACKVLINYLKKLNIGNNYKIALTTNGISDKNPSFSSHFLVLVDNKNITYQADCSPSIGYKCGQVENLSSKKLYEYYICLNKDNMKILDYIRMLIFDIVNEKLNDNLINQYLKLLSNLPKDITYNYFIYKCLNTLYKKTNSLQLKSKICENANNLLTEKYNYEKIQINGIYYSDISSYKQLKILKEELDILINEDKGYKRQLEIAQCILHEIIKYNSEYDKKIILDNKEIRFTNITPRLFLITGYNVVLLKPSAYMSNVDAIIKKEFSKDNFIGEYFPNMGDKSEILGLKPMRFFHPMGYKYERSMYGPNDLFLIREPSDILKSQKKELRNSLTNEFDNKLIKWYDGKDILWNSKMFNLVHTTDNPCEAALHFLAGYPEYQVMTRFMYPNPKILKLERERVNGRI